MASSLQLENHLNIPKEEEEEESFCYALQAVCTTGVAMSLKCAIELGVFDIIAKEGPEAKLSSSQIASKLPITNNLDAPSMLDRILRLLASYSVLSCSVANDDDENAGSKFQRLYGLLPASKFLATNKDGISLAPLMLLYEDNVFLASWSQVNESIFEGGIPFNRVHGMHAYEYPGVDPKYNKIFNSAMYNLTSILTKNLLEVYKGFDPNIKQLVDVGGGLGLTLHLITKTYPHIKGINFDLPHVVQHAVSYPGVEYIGGDMFVSVPSGDAILLKLILHNWTDEKCIKLLKNCYKAIPKDGKVIVMDVIVPHKPDTNSTTEKCICALNEIMMTQNPGGKERSKEEFLALATSAGFTGIRFQCCVIYFTVMEFFK